MSSGKTLLKAAKKILRQPITRAGFSLISADMQRELWEVIKRVFFFCGRKGVRLAYSVNIR